MDKEDKVLDAVQDEAADKEKDKDKTNDNSEVKNGSELSDDWKVVEHTHNKGTNFFKALGMIAAIIVILAGMGWSGMKLYDLTQAPRPKSSQSEENEVTENIAEDNSEENKDIEEENNVVDEQRLEEVNKYVHHMANTIIIPVDGKIMGTKEITMESIDEALEMTKGVDEYLYTEISKWKEGDFNNAVEVHNYVWKNLGGEIGKAKSLDEDTVAAIKLNLGF